jgi:uncharacterized membrane protein
MNTATSNRIISIDILRGLVMIIMALDHTRDFFHHTAMTADPLDPATTTTALFFTRWITHFCAPTFVFLSGLSAYLSSQSKPVSQASLFLIKRGSWLIVAEIVLVTLGLTFDPMYRFILLQVIWAIGCSMIILGLLMRTSYYVILIVGLILFFAHNLFDYVRISSPGVVDVAVTVLLNAKGAVYTVAETHTVAALYAILPWTGVMLLGYSIGPVFTKQFSKQRRTKVLLIIGSSLIILFIVLRMLGAYGDPSKWNPGEHALFSFLNTSKYPPSLQYCCMTLGPAILLLVLFENIQFRWTKVVSVYGRVPFFYYLLHFYILHTLLAIMFFVSGHSTAEIFDPQSFMAFRPVNFGYGLLPVYVIWISVVAALYKPSMWFNHYKATHRQWWLKYL